VGPVVIVVMPPCLDDLPGVAKAPEEDESVYVWIRRFESEEERVRLYAAVYDTDYWKNEVTPRVTELIKRETINAQRLTATRLSTMQ
jgi:hypothetical protein